MGVNGPGGVVAGGLPPVLHLRAIVAAIPRRPAALLITDADGRVEDFDLAALYICTTATMAGSHFCSPLPVSELVTQIESGALTDTARRMAVRAALRMGIGDLGWV
ncbi:MAG: hypothetical protein WCS20_15930, partial [Alphaproteobacteria bacterium]